MCLIPVAFLDTLAIRALYWLQKGKVLKKKETLILEFGPDFQNNQKYPKGHFWINQNNIYFCSICIHHNSNVFKYNYHLNYETVSKQRKYEVQNLLRLEISSKILVLFSWIYVLLLSNHWWFHDVRKFILKAIKIVVKEYKDLSITFHKRKINETIIKTKKENVEFKPALLYVRFDLVS